MVHDDGYVIVFNGEIYNYPQLRQSLERRGVRFRTRCDTEAILHLYALYGRDCVQHLNGMFAFALWDPHDEVLFFARDRVGEKPIYLTRLGGSFVFASEIKALLEHPALVREVNEAVLDAYLANLVTSSPATLFKGIQKLPAGFRGICTSRGVEIEPYWSVFAPRTSARIPFEEAAQSVRSASSNQCRSGC